MGNPMIPAALRGSFIVAVGLGLSGVALAVNRVPSAELEPFVLDHRAGLEAGLVVGNPPTTWYTVEVQR
jgi:hypothetical protein